MIKYSYVIMAGGRGERMGSGTPKPLREIDGKSMLEHSVLSAREAEADKIVVVYGSDQVAERASELGCDTAYQAEPRGTADALKKALPKCFESGRLMVTCADIPLVSAEIFRGLAAYHARENNYLTILSAEAPDQRGYGRILKKDGGVKGIVEEAEASDEEKKIKIVNSGVYCMERGGLEKYLSMIEKSAVKGEYYLTELVGILDRDGKKIGEWSCDWRYVRGVNTPEELSEAARLLKRIRREDNG